MAPVGQTALLLPGQGSYDRATLRELQANPLHVRAADPLPA